MWGKRLDGGGVRLCSAGSGLKSQDGMGPHKGQGMQQRRDSGLSATQGLPR